MKMIAKILIGILGILFIFAIIWFGMPNVQNIFKDKTVSIFGGGDSALDWAVELSANSNVNLIHRREEFRGAQSTLDKVYELE